MKKNKHYHIVVSPPAEKRPQIRKYFDSLSPLIKKHSTQYCFALEHGSNTELTHIDIYVEFKSGQDSTDIKRKYSKLFDFPFQLPAVMIKSIKTQNPSLMTGYTLKENPEIYETNMEDDKLEENSRIYAEKVKEKHTKQIHKSIRLKKIIELIGYYLENRKIEIWAKENIKRGYEPYTLNEIPRQLPYGINFDRIFEQSVENLLFEGYYLEITEKQKFNIYCYFSDYYVKSDTPPCQLDYVTQFMHPPLPKE